MIRLSSFICLLGFALNVRSQNNFTQFIIEAQKISTRYLDSVYGKDAVNKSIRLDKIQSTITGGGMQNGMQKQTKLTDYSNDFRPLLISFTYDFIYNGDTMHSINVSVNDSLQVVDNPNYEQINFMGALAWRYAMIGEFKFNYEDVKHFIKNDKSIDTSYNQVTLDYDYLPKKIIHNNRTFIEAIFFWTISVYSSIKYPGDNYTTQNEIREIKIDAASGKIIQDVKIATIPHYR